jgi:hypothetical protein
VKKGPLLIINTRMINNNKKKVFFLSGPVGRILFMRGTTVPLAVLLHYDYNLYRQFKTS